MAHPISKLHVSVLGSLALGVQRQHQVFCSLSPLPQSDHSFALSPARVQTSDAVVKFEYHEQ